MRTVAANRLEADERNTALATSSQPMDRPGAGQCRHQRHWHIRVRAAREAASPRQARSGQVGTWAWVGPLASALGAVGPRGGHPPWPPRRAGTL